MHQRAVDAALHIADAAIDLGGHLALFGGAHGNMLHHRADTFDPRQNLVKRLAGLAGTEYTGLNLTLIFRHAQHGLLNLALHRADHATDFLGRATGFFRQLAHLIGDHRKAATLFPGPSRLNRRIEG